MRKWLLAWWFLYNVIDTTGNVVRSGESGPYNDFRSCQNRREARLAWEQRPRIDAKDLKKPKALPPHSVEATDCVEDSVNKMPR